MAITVKATRPREKQTALVRKPYQTACGMDLITRGPNLGEQTTVFPTFLQNGIPNRV